MIEPFLLNMDIILRVSRKATYSGNLEDHIRRCVLCEFIKNEWARLRPDMCTYAQAFSLHEGCVVVPYNVEEKKALYLPLNTPDPARIAPFDFDNPPADVAYVDEPTVATKVTGLAKAMFDWAKAGFQLAPSEVYASRLDTCKTCDSWSNNAFLGAGSCAKCGCSGVKLKLATSKCPIGKWDAVNNS